MSEKKSWTHNKKQKFNKANKNLDKEFQRLPGELLADEIEEKGKVHELDSPHEREQIIDDFFAEDSISAEDEEKAALEEYKKTLGDPNDFTLTQAKIDLIRFNIIRVRVDNALKMIESGRENEAKELFEEKCYVWFPKNNTEKRELRFGNPPGDAGRIAKGCAHLKGYKLHIDLIEWPRRITDFLMKLSSFKKRLPDTLGGLRSENADGLIIPAGSLDLG